MDCIPPFISNVKSQFHSTTEWCFNSTILTINSIIPLLFLLFEVQNVYQFTLLLKVAESNAVNEQGFRKPSLSLIFSALTKSMLTGNFGNNMRTVVQVRLPRINGFIGVMKMEHTVKRRSRFARSWIRKDSNIKISHSRSICLTWYDWKMVSSNHNQQKN